MYDELVTRLRRMLDWELCDYDHNFKFADETIAEAADAIEELSKPRWIPVTERLPDIGSNCLISPVSGCVAEGQFDGDGWTQYRWSAKLDKDTITHWMPLPEPPKEEA